MTDAAPPPTETINPWHEFHKRLRAERAAARAEQSKTLNPLAIRYMEAMEAYILAKGRAIWVAQNGVHVMEVPVPVLDDVNPHSLTVALIDELNGLIRARSQGDDLSWELAVYDHLRGVFIITTEDIIDSDEEEVVEEEGATEPTAKKPRLE